jgi:haloacetate dehalogenase
MWHRVAPALAQRHFTVVLMDLRGYGDSGRPLPDAMHRPTASARWRPTRMAVMAQLGFQPVSGAGA